MLSDRFEETILVPFVAAIDITEVAWLGPGMDVNYFRARLHGLLAVRSLYGLLPIERTLRRA
jgi:hypothetical protein